MGAWQYRNLGTEEDPVHQSDLATFARCPRLLRFRRDEALGERHVERKIHGIRVSGTASHGVLRRALPYAVEGRAVNLPHVRAAFFDELDKACAAEGTARTGLSWRSGQKPDDHWRKAIAGLFHFLVVAAERIKEVVLVEAPFRSVLRRRDQEIHTAGTWDIVFRTRTGALALADYKGGEQRPTAFERNFGFQLSMYAQAMAEGTAEDGTALGAWPDETWIVMVRDFLPSRRDSSRKVWDPDEAAFFRVRPGQTVRIRKGQQKGPGWYRAERGWNEASALAEAVGNIVGICRMGKFPKVLNRECAACSFKGPCVQETFGSRDMKPSEKRRLEAALADIPLDELDIGFGEGEP